MLKLEAEQIHYGKINVEIEALEQLWSIVSIRESADKTQLP